MGQYSQAIAGATTANVISGLSSTSAQGLRTVFGEIEAAVNFLEGLTRGAKIFYGSTAPFSVIGLNGDAYLNLSTGDFFYKSADEWQFGLSLKGKDGKTPRLGVDYQNGYTPIFGLDYFNGNPGKSAYQSWLDSGFTGSEAAFANWMKGGPGDDGQRGSLITAGETVPAEAAFVTEPAKGDVYFQTLPATAQLRLHLFDGSGWQVLYTSPQGAAVADGSITNAKLATDIKIGSLSAAANAFPAADQVNLTTVEKFLVWCGRNLSELIIGLAGLTTRVRDLEARVATGTGTGTGAGTANYPTQSSATANQYLQSTGETGKERWATPPAKLSFGFQNYQSLDFCFFDAILITRIEKSVGLATLSYSINGAAAVTIGFSNDVWAGNLNIPARATVTWSVTFTATANAGQFSVRGTETLTA